VLRNHAKGYELLDLFIGLVPNEKWGVGAASAFQVIVGEDDLLNKANHAVIRLLYKQRFFATVFPKIVQNANSLSDDSGKTTRFVTDLVGKSNYLIALSNVIANIPKDILLPELPSLLPLLLQSLSLPSATLRANAINTIYVMTVESPEIIATHIEQLIPILLEQVTLTRSNPPAVRIAALRCLSILPNHISFEFIDSWKQRVIRHLALVLDDPKRQVRKEAVDCRHAWYSSTGKTS
jgi:DNA repair/transcription protein MET18/MMS19